MTYITAEQAKKISDDFEPDTSIDTYVNIIDLKIKRFANKGYKRLKVELEQGNYFEGMPINDIQWANIKQHYFGQGFGVSVRGKDDFASLTIEWE